MSSVRAIPEGYHTVTPYLTCKNTAQAIDYYKSVFGAVETVCMKGPDGRIGHAELRIGDSMVMLSDEFPGMNAAPTPGVKNADRKSTRLNSSHRCISYAVFCLKKKKKKMKNIKER